MSRPNNQHNEHFDLTGEPWDLRLLGPVEKICECGQTYVGPYGMCSGCKDDLREQAKANSVSGQPDGKDPS